jgi:hypothetical protein
LKVGGFDEDFLHGPFEDIDFGHRLFRAGAQFIAPTEAEAVHLPHETSERGVEASARSLNRRLFQAKDRCPGSELVAVMTSVQAALLVPRLEQLALPYVLPHYSEEVLAWVKRITGAGALVSGAPYPYVLDTLAASAALAHSTGLCRRLAEACPSVVVHHAIGCSTGLAEDSLPAMIWTDAFRLFEDRIRGAQIRESLRIARDVFLFATRDDSPLVDKPIFRTQCRSVTGWGWARVEELARSCEATGTRLILRGEEQGMQLFVVSRG